VDLTIEEKITETDVLIIGNGPSAISLSYMLSGWTPYYRPSGVSDDDLLHLRLSYQAKDHVPITEMNLQELSDGLEGRTSNPVALVFDQLCRPYADIGLNMPSQLRWERQENRAIKHIVVGKEIKPGGVWQNIQGDLKTLSRSLWMGLPDLDFKDFLDERRMMSGDPDHYNAEERARVSHVTEYYEYYVQKKGLQKNFINGCLVTSVEKLAVHPMHVDEESGEAICNCSRDGDHKHEDMWEATCLDLNEDSKTSGQVFRIRAKNIVLAVGTSDLPNTVPAPGTNLEFVKHCVKNVAKELDDIEEGSDTVLVVGAGLSAADAIQTAHKKGLNVMHVFRETPCGNPVQMMKKLPKAIYPEYVQMYELMCGDLETDWYRPYPHFKITEFLENQRVMLENELGDQEILEASIVLLQVGTSPDLSFMPLQGTNLGVVDGKKIDLKHNPLDVDPFTNESCSEPGLYGIGPLVGDNFVRFITGGAVAITQHIQMKNALITM